ncbi:unnamed protein product [Linum trigynum]|uniref:Uncharacterized protein n=1 Tax=Linum trigynum TaxID=586398 RepID=A0AAV2CQU6_9ROSI
MDNILTHSYYLHLFLYLLLSSILLRAHKKHSNNMYSSCDKGRSPMATVCVSDVDLMRNNQVRIERGGICEGRQYVIEDEFCQ